MEAVNTPSLKDAGGRLTVADGASLRSGEAKDRHGLNTLSARALNEMTLEKTPAGVTLTAQGLKPDRAADNPCAGKSWAFVKVAGCTCNRCVVYIDLTNNPNNHNAIALAVSPSLSRHHASFGNTWRPAILKYKLRAAGLGHYDFGTWRPSILESKLQAAGLRHLALASWRQAILEYRLLAGCLRHLG